ncbi:MAG: nucleotidyltransferase domain-containing protein [Anaerolineae bacterium]|nr:nucleotidyltransferase domain-containing protein [Anaerolineae bacterium]
MTSTRHPPQIDLPMDAIAVFCQRWHITELALFGSVLLGDFGPDSDIDVLVTFAPEYRYTLANTLAMEQELASILGREIDLINRRVIEQSENYIRRRAILTSARTIYAAC